MMAIEVFGAGAVQTAYVSYLPLDITENSLTLLWPTTYVNAPYVDPSTGIHYNILAASMDVTTPVLNINTITLPNATQASVGQNFILTNVGLDDFNLLTADEELLQVAAPGISYWVQLTGNTTVEGVWTVITFGAGTSEASAAALAGNGLTAIATRLNTNVPIIKTNITPTLNDTDRAKLIVWTGGVTNIVLPAINSVPAGYYVSFNNVGSGQITLRPGEPDTTIDSQLTLAVAISQSLSVISDGTNWWTLGFGQNQFAVVSSLSLDVSANVDITLTNLQASNIIQNYFDLGDLTADITIFFPANSNYWYVNNQTTGSGSISVQLAGPLGDQHFVTRGTQQIFYTDGFNLYPIPTAIQLVDGTESRPSISFIQDGHTGVYRNTGDEGIGFSIEGHLSALIQNEAGSGVVSAVSYPGRAALQMISSDAIGSINYNDVPAILLDDTGVVTIEQGPLLIPDGGISTPSLAFITETETGIFRDATPGAPAIGFSINGQAAFGFQENTAGFARGISAISPGGRSLQLNSGNVQGLVSYNSIIAITISGIGEVAFPASPLAISSGGTGATTDDQAIINLMPAAATGGIAYFDGSDWVTLAIGTPGQVLTVAGGVPTWA
jgi:hypothetical protein